MRLLELLPALISIHAPRGGSDDNPAVFTIRYRDFNPRSPWGERPLTTVLYKSEVKFQSTLPVGGATSTTRLVVVGEEFQSTLPVGGATPTTFSCRIVWSDFNPRSPWGERLAGYSFAVTEEHFNPRSPWGERRQNTVDIGLIFTFQSTLPVGGATYL